MSRPSRPATCVPRYQLPEYFALAALRHGAMADACPPSPGAANDTRDEHRGEAAAFEAAGVAMQSHRRLGDAVEMMRRLMSRLEQKPTDAVCSAAWRDGYLSAAGDAVAMMQRALAEEPFDGASERRNSGEFRFDFAPR